MTVVLIVEYERSMHLIKILLESGLLDSLKEIFRFSDDMIKIYSKLTKDLRPAFSGRQSAMHMACVGVILAVQLAELLPKIINKSF